MATKRDEKKGIDGRSLRSERSRQMIADALYELVGEGVLLPTGEQVALRAGLSLRTVFRLFDDRDGLFRSMDERLRGEIMPQLEKSPPAGYDLNERALALLSENCSIWERCEPYLRSTKLQMMGSEYLTRSYASLIEEGRSRLIRWIPELVDGSPDLLEAMHMCVSFEAWDRLRSVQGLGRARTRATLQRVLMGLLNELRADG